MVIGTPDIDDVRKAAQDLVAVVGDISRKIGMVAVGAKYYPIFFIAKIAATKPPGPVVLIKKAGLLERLNGTPDRAAVDQALFRIPGLVRHAKALEIQTDILDQRIPRKPMNTPEAVITQSAFGARYERIEHRVIFFGQIGEKRPGVGLELTSFLTVQRGSNIEDVIPLVGRPRERQRFSAQFQIPQPDAERENIHLPTRVIDVVLTQRIVACSTQYSCKGVTISRAAAVPDMQRPGRVGRNKFDHDFLAGSGVTGAVGRFAQTDLAGQSVEGGRRQKQIDKTRARYFGPRQQFRSRQGRTKFFGEFAGFQSGTFCQHHRQVARKVAVFLAA